MWLCLVIGTLGFYLLSVPAEWQELLQVCKPLHCNPLQLSSSDMPSLVQLHLSFKFYAVYNLTFFLAFTLRLYPYRSGYFLATIR